MIHVIPQYIARQHKPAKWKCLRVFHWLEWRASFSGWRTQRQQTRATYL